VVSPGVSGSVVGLNSQDMADTYWQIGAAFKQQINENLSYAVIFDQPFGADATYSATSGYPLAGTTAEFQGDAITGVLNYRMDNGFGVHGGLRVQKVSAQSTTVAGGAPIYNVLGAVDYGAGYLAGVSYEKPEIALRVSLTYNSKIKTKHDTFETSALGVNRFSVTEIETPQSVNLDFQTGVAANTLVFGGVRWVDWSDFVIDPTDYRTVFSSPFLSYSDDTYTYTLGVGRRFNKTWSGSLSMTYEDGDSTTPVSNLGPTSGKFGVTLGARYQDEGFAVSSGVNVTWIGDATTNVPVALGPPPITAPSNFSDNMAVGVGFKISWNY
jgi:long-subunit fatty acid transport protein